jgi:excisionase family DNA binding protein
MEEELLKPREVSKILKVSLATVYNMVRAKQIPCVKWELPGGKEAIRLKRNDVFSFINANYNGQSGHKG